MDHIAVIQYRRNTPIGALIQRIDWADQDVVVVRVVVDDARTQLAPVYCFPLGEKSLDKLSL